MSKLRKISLYLNTVKHLKPSQVYYRVWRKFGGQTRLKFGYTPKPDIDKTDINRIPVLPELDFDEVFLARFDVDAILDDRLCLLHHEETVDWDNSWHKELSTPLWRFNLHYCEYLLPLAKAFIDSGDVRYLNKGKEIILSWIKNCPESKAGSAWDSYTISIRIVNWLAFYGEQKNCLQEDDAFVAEMNRSILEQYKHLASRLEVDLLANHYLENLKALVLLASYFNDKATLNLVSSKLIDQVNEQILPDGVHYELSPMYHKIVLEDLLRVCAVLSVAGAKDEWERVLRIQDMCNSLYSLERYTNRTPLFNDSGDNVAKSYPALLECARVRFGVTPVFQSEFQCAGYYILEKETASGLIKVVFDAGRPGPTYAMGHVHCDALSFEVYFDGVPWIINLGTYAYQDESRLLYKRVASHSTATVGNKEQHECWASFRVAKFGEARLIERGNDWAEGVFAWSKKTKIYRRIELRDDSIVVTDRSSDAREQVNSAFLFATDVGFPKECKTELMYAPDFGLRKRNARMTFSGSGSVTTKIDLPIADRTRKD